jgi:hypothetical protein
MSQYEAVALFADRAQAVKADFAVTSSNAPAVAEICVKLDGLPLAIELAAARAKLLSPQALLVRLEQRFELLTGGPRDLPERQQTLRATIDWSYKLLGPEEQTLFARLAVFVGGCTLEAAEKVCGGAGILTGLATLIDNSLLRQDEQPDGEPRFTMLEASLPPRAAPGKEADEIRQRQCGTSSRSPAGSRKMYHERTSTVSLERGTTTRAALTWPWRAMRSVVQLTFELHASGGARLLTEAGEV